MTEQEFIYGKLKHLTEQIDQLTYVVERQQDMIENMLMLIDKMQSPEYIRKQAKIAEMTDVIEKVEFIRNLNKK